MVKVFLHSCLRFIWKVFLSLIYSIFDITNFLFYLFMHVGILRQNFVQLIAALFLLSRFYCFCIFSFQVLDFVIIFVKSYYHLSNCLDIFKELFIYTFILLTLLIILALIDAVIRTNIITLSNKLRFSRHLLS